MGEEIEPAEKKLIRMLEELKETIYFDEKIEELYMQQMKDLYTRLVDETSILAKLEIIQYLNHLQKNIEDPDLIAFIRGRTFVRLMDAQVTIRPPENLSSKDLVSFVKDFLPGDEGNIDQGQLNYYKKNGIPSERGVFNTTEIITVLASRVYSDLSFEQVKMMVKELGIEDVLKLITAYKSNPDEMLASFLPPMEIDAGGRRQVLTYTLAQFELLIKVLRREIEKS